MPRAPVMSSRMMLLLFQPYFFAEPVGHFAFACCVIAAKEQARLWSPGTSDRCTMISQFTVSLSAFMRFWWPQRCRLCWSRYCGFHNASFRFGAHCARVTAEGEIDEARERELVDIDDWHVRTWKVHNFGKNLTSRL